MNEIRQTPVWQQGAATGAVISLQQPAGRKSSGLGKYFCTAAVLLLLAGTGCKKNLPKGDPAAQAAARMTGGASVNSDNNFIFGPENATTGYRYTVLGRKYGDVFNVSNVLAAWNSLSEKPMSQLEPTHLYVRFAPQNAEELKALADADIPVYTHPLDHEIVMAGDYMQDPASEPNGIPPLYACLPVTQVIPDVTYQLLDKLCLLDLRSVVAKKAFELAGEMDYYPGNPEQGEVIPAYLLTTANNIQEHFNLDADWGGYRRSIVLPPFPSDPVNPAQNIDNPPSTVANVCACNNNGDDRMPSGCIKVEETQWWNGAVRYEGVNDIMADFVGPYFQRISVWTNPNGCYKSDSKMRYKVWTPFGTIRLPVIMSAIFVSGKKTVKGLNHNGNMFEYALPMTHCIWSVQGGGLNNVSITYLRDWNKDDNETKYYACATVNNSIYDYDGYCSQDGILKSPDNLQVLVHKYSESSAAPMFHKLLMSGSIPTATAAGFIVATTGALPVIGTWGIGELMVLFPPDIAYGYNDGTGQVGFSTDQLKEEAYHELSHSSHYRKAGNSLWENNIFFVATHNGYGNPGDNGVERSDLIEMWAYYNGRDLAHRRYGANRHSRGTLSGFANTFENSWYGFNEARIFDATNHIAGGFLQDIRDDNAYNISHGLNEAGSINDQIHGYTKLAMFNLLGSGTTSAASFITQLGSGLPLGNSMANFNALKSNYGY